jgi:hypothetical protein
MTGNRFKSCEEKEMKTKLKSSWKRQKENERRGSQEDVRLRELMKTVKLYIRNIDVNTL